MIEVLVENLVILGADIRQMKAAFKRKSWLECGIAFVCLFPFSLRIVAPNERKGHEVLINVYAFLLSARCSN